MEVMKRINIPAIVKDQFLVDTRMKSASGFIEDVSTNNGYVVPRFIHVTAEDAFQLYRFNEWVFATVNRIVDDCVKIHPIVTTVDREKKENSSIKRRKEKVLKFLRKPNGNKQTFRELRKKYINSLLVYGLGSYEMVLDNDGDIIELHPMQAHKIEIATDSSGNLKERDTYLLRKNVNSLINTRDKRTIVKFDKNEVLFSVLYPVSTSLYGVKPLDNLANAVASDMLRADYNSNFFVNNGEARGILSLDGMNKNELKKFRQYWSNNFRGSRNAHKIAAVNTKVDFMRMALSNQDMQFSEYGIEIRKKIFAVFGMQPIIMGITDTTDSKDKSAQVECYKDGAIRPILSIEAEDYTKDIIHNGFGYDDLRISFEGVNLLDKKTQSEIDAQDLTNGTRTINEIRSDRGMSPVPWGDTPITMFPGGGQVDPVTGRLIPPSQQTGNNNQNVSQPNKDKKPK